MYVLQHSNLNLPAVSKLTLQQTKRKKSIFQMYSETMEMTTGRRVIEATVRLNEVKTSFIMISISPYWPMIVFCLLQTGITSDSLLGLRLSLSQ